MALVTAIAAVAISALTMIVISMQVAEAKKANVLPVTIDLFREYRSANMERARRLLTDQLPRLDPVTGIRGLPDDLAAAASQISQYLDNLGVLVARGLLDPQLTAGFIGDSVLRYWRLLSPFVLRERQLRTPPHYQQYFEHLAATVQQAEPARARARLRTFSDHPSPGNDPASPQRPDNRV